MFPSILNSRMEGGVTGFTKATRNASLPCSRKCPLVWTTCSGGREGGSVGGREGVWEGGRECGREEGGREGGRKGGRVGGTEVSRQIHVHATYFIIMYYSSVDFTTKYE